MRDRAGFSKRPSVATATFYKAAITSTSAIFSVLLTLFTLTVLYQGLQKFQMVTAKQESLRNHTFFCILLPIVVIYFAKITLLDYLKSLCSRRMNDTDEY